MRDRFGKKPLYYAHLPEGLFFGSELKCLRAAGVPLDVDPEALRLYFQFTYIPDPWSPYRQVRKLPPGSWLLYHADGRVEQGSLLALAGALRAGSARIERRRRFAEITRHVR